MKAVLILCLVLVGCSKWGDPVPGTKMSGDLSQFIVQTVTTRGGHPATNGLAVVQADWTVQSNLVQHTIYVHGDHFGEIESLFAQVFGAANTERGSSPAKQVGNYPTRSGWYSVQQAGVGLSFSGDAFRPLFVSTAHSKHDHDT